MLTLVLFVQVPQRWDIWSIRLSVRTRDLNTKYKRQFEGGPSGCLILYSFSKEQFDSAMDYMYRAGTLVTLRDGNVYRTSKKTVCVCEYCIDYYKKHNLRKPCSIFGDKPRPFGDKWWLLNNEKCTEMYGSYQFPKQVFPKSSSKTGCKL